MTKKFAFKQYFLEEKYRFLKSQIQYSIYNGVSLSEISEQSGVHLWTLRNFYYSQGQSLSLPVKCFIDLLDYYGYKMEFKIIPKH